MSARKVVGGVRLTEGLQVAEFDWVSDTRLVYSIAERIPGREQPAATGEMYAVDYNGKNHAIIYGVRALGERPSLREWIGIAMVAGGVLVLAFKR